ncbi:MAG: TonB-dependent receptor [Bacteroidia bacterium 43-41]|nr:MAG: TonB-dependent receptor [Bacteroidia bacterium 43-41]
MKKTVYVAIAALWLSINSLYAQKTDSNVFGDVQSNGVHVPFVTIAVKGTTIGTTTDETGHYMLTNLPAGRQTLVAQSVGYKSQEKVVEIEAGRSIEINFKIEEEIMHLDDVVVTGTRTFKRRTETPIVVNVLDAKSLDAVQACNISEGLRFQPGLRVETDCQTCSYTQLRMNGLGGGYSQILINGRPVFSPLIGLYGMEQIPANMVERIEVVRGGGSALYGSSAIGGTVNVITQIPTRSDYEVSFTTNSINGAAIDNVLTANTTMLSRNKKAGVSLFANRRVRDFYDHPGITLKNDGTTVIEKDNFSELPALESNSFGGNLIFTPTHGQKLEVNFSSLYEYRYGGEMIKKEAHLAKQSEERTHNILMGGLDYQINFNNDNSSFISYFAGQKTKRNHYTGLYPAPDDFDTPEEFAEAEAQHLKNPPYGYTSNHTLQAGVQFNHRLTNFIKGTNVLTVGTEYLLDDILDSIPHYQYGVDQTTKNAAAFLQSDWKLSNTFTVLTGVRADKHNLVNHVILSPRVSMLYRLKNYTQFRLTWGTGFRAPQAFDTDMHIAFAGGGVSRISLAPDLKEERSNSFSGSVNYDKATENYIYGFTLEGFYTKLNDAFHLQPVGRDEYGEQFEKQNGPGATVKGVTLELRANYNKKVQLESGFTWQKSLHSEAVENIEGLEAKREFLRTPNDYGYAILSFFPVKNLNASVSSVYTGKMLLAKFSPNIALRPNEYRTSPSFTEFSAKVGYTFELPFFDSGLEIFGGVKNIGNFYQNDFDNYRNRDSNYVWGPGLPRTFYVGLKVMAL